MEIDGKMPADCRTRHMLIAGTGRAGTSFLVKYLHALGLETHLAHNNNPQWSEFANAGLEDLPVFQEEEQLPYVIKSPWVGNVLDQMLNSKYIKIDVVLVPIRDLYEAASSRVITEIQRIYADVDWMSSLTGTWREWGITEGGVVFSLDPIDQERILAVQLTRLLQSLVAADIPVVFLDFPRIVEDGAYLYEKLKGHLSGDIKIEAALGAHREVASVELVRVEREREAVARVWEPGGEVPLKGQVQARPSGKPERNRRDHAVEELTAVALDRELARRKRKLREARELEQLAQVNARLQEQIRELREKLEYEKLEREKAQRRRKSKFLQRMLLGLGRRYSESA